MFNRYVPIKHGIHIAQLKRLMLKKVLKKRTTGLVTTNALQFHGRFQYAHETLNMLNATTPELHFMPDKCKHPLCILYILPHCPNANASFN